MIAKHNMKQFLLAVGSLFGAVIAYAFSKWFMGFSLQHISSIVSTFFGHEIPVQGVLAWVLVMLVTAAGYQRWRSGGGFQTINEAGMVVRLDDDTGGAWTVRHYAQQYATSAYLITQALLAGPLLVLKAWDHWNNQIPQSKTSEASATEMLVRLRTAGKWQGLADYAPEDHAAILMLGKMEAIDFSVAKGTPRFKAFTEDGNDP